MRRPSLVKHSGPYKCVSYADGRIEVTPRWPQYQVWIPETGGGPGVGSRIALAAELERWLNEPYSSESQPMAEVLNAEP